MLIILCEQNDMSIYYIFGSYFKQLKLNIFGNVLDYKQNISFDVSVQRQ